MKNIVIPIEENEICQLEEDTSRFTFYTLKEDKFTEQHMIVKKTEEDIAEFLKNNNVNTIITLGISNNLNLKLKENNFHVVILNDKERLKDFIHSLT
ncbi:NifB/NifX family molybdenum-iron cluster-binding protein [Clostridium sp. Marseille-Q2269]|uniref:NifB/NifX family molybdenum-iron cluster-binding protein n=1 Tax=Clostridium sp. Marseille-Q2269 TaxID=2942205 RepID=UPI002073150A|nr:NifB/NifX family molybdenum-iron cluster-binding protein [Clostridium sp. Marseille-Q2269]